MMDKIGSEKNGGFEIWISQEENFVKALMEEGGIRSSPIPGGMVTDIVNELYRVTPSRWCCRGMSRRAGARG